MQQTWKPWWHFGKIRTLSLVANSDRQMTHSVSKLGNSSRLAGQILNGGMWMHCLSYLDKRNQVCLTHCTLDGSSSLKSKLWLVFFSNKIFVSSLVCLIVQLVFCVFEFFIYC